MVGMDWKGSDTIWKTENVHVVIQWKELESIDFFSIDHIVDFISHVSVRTLFLLRTPVSTRRSFCRSVPIEGQSSASSSIETTSLKSIEKESSIDENPELLMEAILEKDKELARVLQEKELLLGRLLNISPSQSKDAPGFVSRSATLTSGLLQISSFRSARHRWTKQIPR